MENNKTITSLSGFRWWKRRQQFRFLKLALCIFLVLAFVSVALWFAGINTFTLAEQIFAVATIILFASFGVWQIVSLFRSFSWKVDVYWYGTIIDTRRNLLPNRKVKDYNITTDVGGKEVEGICFFETYKRAELGQIVVLFSIGDGKIYCVHPEM